MIRFLKISFFSIFLFTTCICNAQTHNDSLRKTSKFEKFKPYIVPTVFIGYGLVSLNSNKLQSFDSNIDGNFDATQKTAIDDITMVLPTLSVYGLNFLGNKGKHNFKDRTLLISTATAILLASTFSLKKSTKRTRPNFVDTESFPSAHTALSFMGAEFLCQEYKHKSIWYGIAGYTIATGTAYLRIYNKEHWFSDVVTGAGIGVISTKLAYLINPFLQKKFFKKKEIAFVSPFYNGEQVGLSLVKSF